MPFDISRTPDYALIRVTGTVSAEDLHGLARSMKQLEDENPPFDRITDLTGIESIDVAYPEVHDFANQRSARQFSRTVRSALVANQPLQVGYARMFQSLNDNASIEIRVFRSFDDASRWVCEG